MTKVTYLDHSGFLVETATCALIFDYDKGAVPALFVHTPLYVLVSHNHGDHFNPGIFALQQSYPNTTYILSDDIKPQTTVPVTFVTPDTSMEFPHFNLKTTDSSDEGVSFLLSLHNGQTIFHAGDLHWWTWYGEQTEEEGKLMETRFKKEVAKLTGIPIDLAFLPLDPRLLDRYYWGFDYYMRTLNISRAFPMHFWNDNKIIDRLMADDCSREYRDKIQMIRKGGDVFQ